jgi:phosphoribosyl-ATP pyrophosphohydrolase/phosphoribosyl-AMP cyclohydrolase
VRRVLLDCDGDCVLLLVEQKGAACHTGEPTCFFRGIEGLNAASAVSYGAGGADGGTVSGAADGAAILYEIADTVRARAENPEEGSYTNYLLEKGTDKICKKVGEEAAETIIAAVNKDNVNLTGELADLLYHIIVLAHVRGVQLDEVFAVLGTRHSSPRARQYGKPAARRAESAVKD